MNMIFEKFGIFDFLGIMGPGLISTIYYYTSYSLVCSEQALFQKAIESDAYFLVAVAFLLISYFFGVIIHEIGKIMYDCIPYFNTNKIKNRLYIQSNSKSCYGKLKEQISQIINKLEKSPEIDINKYLKELYDELPDDNTKEYISFSKHIDNEYNEIVQSINNDIGKKDFNEALAVLKYSDTNKKRIDTYHSVYAQARGCFISLLFNLILLIGVSVYRYSNDKPVSEEYLSLFLVINIVLTAIFFIRSYRYYISWIRNVYMQYYVIIGIIK